MVLAAEVLYEWREAERTLRLLPPDAPDRPAVEAAVEEMRALYHRVTTAVPVTRTAIASARQRIAETQVLLTAIREAR